MAAVALAEAARLLDGDGRHSRFRQLRVQRCELSRAERLPLAEQWGQLSVEEYNFLLERDEAAKYGIGRVPAIAVLGARDHGIRFFGMPSGYESMSLLDAILLVSKGDSGLLEGSRAMLASLESSLTLQLFVTPTWPHCPRAVSLANRMALESTKVTSIVVGANEFPDLVRKYQVSRVPKTMVDEKVEILGARPEDDFVRTAIGAIAAP